MKPTDETMRAVKEAALVLINKYLQDAKKEERKVILDEVVKLIAIAEQNEYYDKLVLGKVLKIAIARRQVNLKAPYKVLAKVWELEKQNFQVVSCEQDGRVVKMLLNASQVVVIAYDAKNDEVAITNHWNGQTQTH